MKRMLAVGSALALVTMVVLVPFVPNVPSPNAPLSPFSPLPSPLAPVPSFLTLNAPVPVFQSATGQEITVNHQSFFLDANGFFSNGLDNFDRTLLGNLKVAGGDMGIAISPDRHHATLTNGQTVYYGVKIAPEDREKVRGVTFILVTTPKIGIPNIRDNYFEIKYVESVGGSAGSVRPDTTAGKAYQVISPSGDYWYYFSFKAVVKSGGILTEITPVFFGGPKVAAVAEKYIVCCWEQITTPLLDVPKCIPISWWYCFPIIDVRAIWAFQCALYKKIALNTASVPCTNPEATGKSLTILGAGFNALADTPLAQSIHVTDDLGQVATVTSAAIVSDNEIAAVIDVDRCLPGMKCVTIDGAQGHGNVTFMNVTNNMTVVIPGQTAFCAAVVRGTCDKVPLTLTTSGEHVTFYTGILNIFNVTKVQTCTPTRVSFFTCGNPTNTGSFIVKGTAIPGTQYFSEYVGEPVLNNFVTSAKPMQNACPIVKVEPQRDDIPDDYGEDPKDPVSQRNVRIMISTYNDDEYHTKEKTACDDPNKGEPAQSEDGKVTITAYLDATVAKVGDIVYFEVDDPDDPSPYIEDKDPDTRFDFAVKPDFNINPADQVDTQPNDNRDPEKNGRNFAKLQSTLSSRSAVAKKCTIDKTEYLVAETVLTITNRYAGDNYVVKATCVDPKGKSFKDAGIPAEMIKESGILTAWKRIYQEEDSSYRVGAPLSRAATKGAREIIVTFETYVDAQGKQREIELRVGDNLRIFDCANRESVTHQVVRRDPLAGGKYRLTLDGALQNGYAEHSSDAGGYAGKEHQGGLQLFRADSSELAKMFRECYMEVRPISEEGSPIHPTSSLIKMFLECHFNNRDKRNVFYTTGSRQDLQFPRLKGITSSSARSSVVFYLAIEQKINQPERRQLLNRDVTCHETVHIFDTDIPIGDRKELSEDERRAWDNSDTCIMNNKGKNLFDGVYRMCFWHLYKVRDFEDGFQVDLGK